MMEAVNFADEKIMEEVLVEGLVKKTAEPVAFVPQIQTNKKSLAPADHFQRYFVEIKRHKLLTREEEKELATRIREKGDPEAANQLVLSNLRLVVKIAFDFQKSWSQNLLDLIQEGNLGLMKAVNKFDPYRGVKFSYYAAFWIKAYMSKYLLDNFRLIKVGTTQNQRKLFFNLGKEKEKLMAQGLEPQPRRLAERLNVKEAEVVEMSQRLGKQERSMTYHEREFGKFRRR
jgi:RNA polymerase sigma-32 factor